ncbi:MAG: flagellar basal body L-ring protein FlgH [Dongiaceae bacterium]
MRKPSVLLLAGIAFSATGCVADRLDHLGKPPSMSPMENPREDPTYRTVNLPMPVEPPAQNQTQTASLWQPGARAFFKDQRAARIGDILTVVIDIDESAKIDNTTSRSRDASESAGLPHLLGFETSLGQILPEGYSPDQLVDLSSASESAGSGSVDRKEKIELQVAAIIVDQLPNGNFIIAGRQEVRVNFELRELTVQGIIRPEDVSPANSIDYDQIAEARISYGGRGQITDVQQPRYGQQVFDMIWPY